VGLSHFLERNNLTMIEFWLGDQQRFVRVLASDIDDRKIRAQWQLSSEEFDKWLSHQVKPLAFQDATLWGSRQRQAEEACQRIGSQLIERYAREYHKDWSIVIREGFAMGAGRFGCFLVFAHSIPKVCLPLFWLGGEVTIDSETIEWKPLFYDARRVGPTY